MEEKLENVNILKEKRAAVDLPFSISSTVPSFSLGHLKDREDDIVKERNGRPSEEKHWQSKVIYHSVRMKELQ